MGSRLRSEYLVFVSTRATILCSCRSPVNAVRSNARDAERRWFSGIGNRMGRRFTAAPNIRNAVARDRHSGFFALQGMNKQSSFHGLFRDAGVSAGFVIIRT